MRILILSCNTGEGHNSCAKALKELFDGKGHYCVIEDALNFISPLASRVISRGHTLIYRYFPGLFRRGYAFAERHPAAYRGGSVLNRFFCSGRQRLTAYLDSEDFDVVICTHTFAGMILTGAKKACKTAFYTAFVGTDYTCSPTTEICDLDVYFIPDGRRRLRLTASPRRSWCPAASPSGRCSTRTWRSRPPRRRRGSAGPTSTC